MHITSLANEKTELLAECFELREECESLQQLQEDYFRLQERWEMAEEAVVFSMQEANGDCEKEARIRALHEVFQVFDFDNGGFIEGDDLFALGKARRSLGHKTGEWTAEKNAKLMQKMDGNGDGLIEPSEFVRHFEETLPRDKDTFKGIIEQFLEVARACRSLKSEARGIPTSPRSSPKLSPKLSSPPPTRRLTSVDDGKKTKSAEKTVTRKTRETASRAAALREVFQLFDLDGGGVVEGEELLKLGRARRTLGHKAGGWTEEKNAKLVKKIAHGNGQVDSSEFVKQFEATLPRDSDVFFDIVDQFLEVAHAYRADRRSDPDTMQSPSSVQQARAMTASSVHACIALEYRLRQTEDFGLDMLKLRGLFDAEKANWEAEMFEVRAHCSALGDKLEVAEEAVVVVVQDHEHVIAQMNSMACEAKRWQKVRREQEVTIHELRQQCGSLREKLEVAEEAVVCVIDEHAAIVSEFQSANGSDSKIAILQQQLDEKELEIARLTRELDMDPADRLCMRCVALEDQLAEAEELAEQAEMLATELHDQTEQMFEEKQTLESALEKANAEVEQILLGQQAPKSPRREGAEPIVPEEHQLDGDDKQLVVEEASQRGAEVYDLVDEKGIGVLTVDKMVKFSRTPEGVELRDLFDRDHVGWTRMWAALTQDGRTRFSREEFIAVYTQTYVDVVVHLRGHLVTVAMHKEQSQMKQIVSVTELTRRCGFNVSGTISYHNLYCLARVIHPRSSYTTAENDRMFVSLNKERTQQVALSDFSVSAPASLLYYWLVVDHGINRVTEALSGIPTQDEVLMQRLAPLFDRIVTKVEELAIKYSERVDQMIEVFMTIDTDNSGEISKEELLQFGKNLHRLLQQGVWDEQRQEAFWRAIDTDGDGCISLWEFVDFYRPVIYDLSDAKFERGRQDFLRAQVQADY